VNIHVRTYLGSQELSGKFPSPFQQESEFMSISLIDRDKKKEELEGDEKFSVNSQSWSSFGGEQLM